MSIIAYEVVGRTGDATQRSLKYHVRDPAKGPVTDADAVTAVLAESPTSHFGFERRSINLSEVGLNYYEVVVQYGEHTVTPAKATPPDGELKSPTES